MVFYTQNKTFVKIHESEYLKNIHEYKKKYIVVRLYLKTWLTR